LPRTIRFRNGEERGKREILGFIVGLGVNGILTAEWLGRFAFRRPGKKKKGNLLLHLGSMEGDEGKAIAGGLPAKKRRSERQVLLAMSTEGPLVAGRKKGGTITIGDGTRLCGGKTHQ